MPARTTKFGFVAAAVDSPGASDAELYRQLLADCDHNRELGFTSVWMIEHHFSDYFPTPDPMLALTHIAARHPDLDVGTCVLVLPWHNPLRLAEQIAMLSVLSDAELHLGLGRGTAKFEFDAFELDMSEARQRFLESYEVLELALRGTPFTFDGEFVRVPKQIRVRPEARRDRIHFYGAIGSPDSARIMGRLGLAPICTSLGDYERQVQTLQSWRDEAQSSEKAVDVSFPLMINCIVGDTDAEAVLEAREFIPPFMQAQVDHYTPDTTDWVGIKGYEAWSKIFEGLKARTVPENIDPWTAWQLIGSPETVARKVQLYVDAGFDHLILQLATPGVPSEARHRWARRFMTEVVPLLSSGAVASAHASP